jgi:CubicO group peptidase (beta-lactamase class C family)
VEIERREMLGMAALFAALLPTGSSASTKPVQRNSKLATTLRPIAEGVVRDRRSAGFGIGLRQNDGQAEVFGFGKANLETGTPVSAETIFRIASCTKQFTAAGIVRLSENGRLSLDDRSTNFCRVSERRQPGSSRRCGSC